MRDPGLSQVVDLIANINTPTNPEYVEVFKNLDPASLFNGFYCGKKSDGTIELIGSGVVDVNTNTDTGTPIPNPDYSDAIIGPNVPFNCPKCLVQATFDVSGVGGALITVKYKLVKTPVVGPPVDISAEKVLSINNAAAWSLPCSIQAEITNALTTDVFSLQTKEVTAVGGNTAEAIAISVWQIGIN